MPSERDTTGSRPALVHDYLLVMRGAERTFLAMANCWPEAPIYTLLYDDEAMRRGFGGRSVHTSYLQRMGVRQRGFRRLMPLFPRAVERLPVAEHDLVVSSSSAFAHGVRRGPDALHVCYCHSPFRYAWHERERAVQETPPPLRPLARRSLRRIRGWDRRASSRVSHYIANSRLTRDRIARYWGREASIVHPPVEVERFSADAPEDYFLTVSELVPHKKVELGLEAARRAGRTIKVIGTGPDHARLAERYGGVAEFLGRVDDARLASVYSRAAALVVPGVEEFGIAAVEAQAAGRPVLAADAGGVQETVVPGETGVLVPPGDVDALAEAMRDVPFERFEAGRAVANAARFSTAEFQRRLKEEVRRLGR
jgi:glycosyltransferase involved in cell wall biosynthesis